MWDDLIQGAIGAVVLVDTRRLADSFPAVDYFESAGLPFIVAVNGFNGDFARVADVQEALSVSPHVPIMECDAAAGSPPSPRSSPWSSTRWRCS